MLLENLPNEVWLMTFKFLTTGELCHAFHGLNNRFCELLVTHFQYYEIDLSSVLKADLNTFCEHYLPSIKSLRVLSNDDGPLLTDDFFSQNLPLDRFNCLQSLSLNRIESIQMLGELITQLSHLGGFIRLEITNFSLSNNRNAIVSLINSVWSLPRLDYLILHAVNNGTHGFPIPRRISPLLRHVELKNFRCCQRNLAYIFERTPCLQYFSGEVVYLNEDQQSKYIATSVNTLNISYNDSWDNLQRFLQIMPNLTSLTIQAWFSCTRDGRVWEQFITDHLPNLQVFRFVIRYNFVRIVTNEDQVAPLLDSFRSPFWLEKHEWCVRCDWQVAYERRCVDLYTIPYVLDRFYDYVSNVGIQSRTTCPHGPDHHSIDSVSLLDYDDRPIPYKYEIPIRFFSIRDLSLTLPINDQFFFIIPCLNHLSFLNLKISNDHSDIHTQLKILLDLAPKLRSLKFIKWPLSISDKLFQQIRSTSIRQLDLTGFSPTGIPQYFNKDQCDMLSRTPLGIQCQVLFITVKEKSNAIDLVRNMTNLRVLVVKSRDDRWDGSLPATDECIEWLRSQLPSTCLFLREPRLFGRIRIWIR